jgi:hypothetical protein
MVAGHPVLPPLLGAPESRRSAWREGGRRRVGCSRRALGTLAPLAGIAILAGTATLDGIVIFAGTATLDGIALPDGIATLDGKMILDGKNATKQDPDK